MPIPAKARAALDRLRAGNDRFANNIRSVESLLAVRNRPDLHKSQNPFAIVLGCSDSRVPAEHVFDQGLGDLFVIRIAGNIVAPSQIGSVEFAAVRFDVPLVVVLGHTSCGAIDATIEALSKPNPESKNLRAIVDRIAPSVLAFRGTKIFDQPIELSGAAMRANVLASVNHLRHGSELLENLVTQGSLGIIGAAYDLETGKVEFFDEPI